VLSEGVPGQIGNESRNYKDNHNDNQTIFFYQNVCAVILLIEAGHCISPSFVQATAAKKVSTT
jgi:hypothetical protein